MLPLGRNIFKTLILESMPTLHPRAKEITEARYRDTQGHCEKTLSPLATLSASRSSYPYYGIWGFQELVNAKPLCRGHPEAWVCPATVLSPPEHGMTPESPGKEVCSVNFC